MAALPPSVSGARRAAAAVLVCALFVGTRVTPFAEAVAAQNRPGSSATSPRRIISLIPATTEMLFAMGAADRLAGVGSYDRFPPEVERLPRVGGLLDPSVERILSLKPDLVIVYDTQTELKGQLARAGIPIFRYAHRGLSDITETMRALGAPCRRGRPPRMRRRRKSSSNSRQSRPAPPNAPDRKRCSYSDASRALCGRSLPAAATVFCMTCWRSPEGSTCSRDLKRQSVQLSTESILALAPEVIIELHYGSSMRADRLDAERLVWNALPSVPAVKNNRVHLLVGDEFVVPGPRIVLAAERFARALHPEAYAR